MAFNFNEMDPKTKILSRSPVFNKTEDFNVFKILGTNCAKTAAVQCHMQGKGCITEVEWAILVERGQTVFSQSCVTNCQNVISRCQL